MRPALDAVRNRYQPVRAVDSLPALKGGRREPLAAVEREPERDVPSRKKGRSLAFFSEIGRLATHSGFASLTVLLTLLLPAGIAILVVAIPASDLPPIVTTPQIEAIASPLRKLCATILVYFMQFGLIAF